MTHLPRQTRQTRTLARALSAFALAGAACAAHAVTYYAWQTVELPVSSGAACGNGSPYRFFVNRTPFTSKTVVIYEGGGACWDQKSCLGGDLLSASNPNGIATNYMSDIQHQLSTPFNSRIDPLQAVQTQSWNIVFVPYCTGDVHTGNKTVVYSDADPAHPLTYMHRGSVNSEAMAAWLKANMPRPDKLLVTGYSAGGTGATANYAVLRTALDPKQSALLADSGPMFPAPRSGSPAQYPSLPLQNKIRDAWGLDGPQGMLTKALAQYPGMLDPDNLGTITTALAKYFPNDRLGYAVFQEDGIYSDYSYSKFYPDIAAATGDARAQMINAKWRQDIGNWTALMGTQPNVGYYIPYGRDIIKSHCLTALTFGGTAIKEAKSGNVGAFVDNLLDGKGTPLRQVETQTTMQKAFGVFSPLVVQLLASMGL
jgi:hypothetical protein